MSEEELKAQVSKYSMEIGRQDVRIYDLEKEIERLKRENAELKARLIEWQLPNPAPFKLNPAMEALMNDPKPQGEE